jgi:ABC-type lipoprotein release transport system permease subunit
MTTKKIIIIVVSVIVVLGLIVVLSVGGIVGFVFYSIGNSEAAKVSKEFLRNNERLKQDIGEVKDFGSFVTGNINVTNGDGAAELHFKVIGERKEVNATVELIFRSSHQWRVTAASYRNEAGEKIDLLNPYESRKVILKLAA